MDTCADCGREKVGPFPTETDADADKCWARCNDAAKAECTTIALQCEKAASASLREQLARVTQERDEARAQVDQLVGDVQAVAEDYTNARSRIEALERALRAGKRALGKEHTTCGGEGSRVCIVCEAHQRIDAALAPAEPAAAIPTIPPFTEEKPK